MSASVSEPAAPQDRRRVVVVPGILGSRLLAKDGSVLWGDRSSLSHFGQLDLDPEKPGDALEVGGFVERIRVLGPFWTVHAYDDLLIHLRVLGFRDGETLFQFPYDWRQSNFVTAEKFQSWLQAQPALRDGTFDIVAHSMGGIATRIWLTQFNGAPRVRKVIYLGTPFQGSMNSLATLTAGWGRFANLIAGGIDTIRNTMLSFPGAIELFPSYPRSSRLGTQRRHQPFNIYDPDLWNAQDWLPAAYRDGAPRGAQFRSNLARAEQIAAIMAQPIPGITEVRIAGDNQNTRLYLYVNRDDQTWRNWNFSFDRGDGTVPLWSAASSRDGNLAGTLPSFVEHATIFRDEWVKVVLQRELVMVAPPPVSARAPDFPMRSGNLQRLDILDATLDPSVVAPNASTRLRVSLRFPADASLDRGDVAGLVARLADTGMPPVPLMETTSDAELAEKILSFAADIRAPLEEEVYRVDIDVPPLGQRALYLTVDAA